MAVKTPFAPADFVNILAQYALGVFTQAEPILQGTVQTNYFITTTQDKFVFRYYENRSEEAVLFESELLTYLTAQRYPCPAPLQNRQGTTVGMARGKPYVIFEFLAGQPVEHPNDQHKAQLIQKAAELQQLTRDYRSPYRAQRWNYDPALCQTLAHAAATRINTPSGHKKFAWLAQELTRLDLPSTLPKGICHCDFHFSNVLFQGDQFVALLDFDDANETFLQFDLVGLIESWAWPYTSDQLDLTKARNVVQAYNQHRPLAPIEQTHLYDVYKLSILLDCVWYFGRGDADDFYERRKIDFLNQVGRQRFFSELFSEAK